MKKRENPIFFVLLLAFSVYMATGQKLPDIKLPKILSKISVSGNNVASVTYPEPSESLKAKVSPVTDRLTVVDGHEEDAAHLAALYAALADAIRRDEKTITTTGQIRIANQKAGAILFAKRKIAGKYAGLKETLEGIVADELGKDNQPLTPELRAKAAALFDALAWACSQAT